MARQPKVQLVIDGKDNTRGAFNAVGQGIGELEKKAKATGKVLGGMMAGLVSIATIKRIADINMEFRQLNKVLRENTENVKEFERAQGEMSRIADELGVSISKVVDDFGGLNGSMAALGYQSKDTIKVTETLSKLMALEGADPSATIKRFTRALSKGELHQARFNLMLQDQPALLDLIAESTGKSINELREMSAQGELTADMMVDAVTSMADTVSERYEEIPKTIEQATERISNNLAEAYSDEQLMQPTVDGLNQLADVLRENETREALAALGAALAKLTEWGVKAAGAFIQLGDDIGYFAARVTGNVSELDKLERELKGVQKQLDGGVDISGWDLIPVVGLWRHTIGKSSKEALEEQKKALEAQRESILEQQTGMTADQREAAAERKRIADEEVAARQAANRAHIGAMEKLRKDSVAEAEKRGNELAKAEKDAAKKVEAARKEGLELENKFDAIRDSIKAGPDKEANFGDYQKLAASARKAMAAGDTTKAKEDAEAAAQVLKGLADAGENTYGFAGLVNSMKQLAVSAQEVEQADAEQELAKIRAEMEALKEQAAELEDMPVSVELDEASLDEVRTKLKKLLDTLKSDATIPVKIAAGGADAGAQKFASGGHVRGPGTGTSDSILARLSDGEYVIKAAAVRKYGVGMLDALNGMHLPKFATGGAVDVAAAAQPRQPQALGTLNFNLPGGDSFSVQTAGEWSDDLRRAAMKFGRPQRR